MLIMLEGDTLQRVEPSRPSIHGASGRIIQVLDDFISDTALMAELSHCVRYKEDRTVSPYLRKMVGAAAAMPSINPGIFATLCGHTSLMIPLVSIVSPHMRPEVSHKFNVSQSILQ